MNTTSKIFACFLTACILQHAEAMSDATQAVVVTSAAGLINAGTAVYLQGQGMNPQFVTLPNGTTTVMPNSNSQQNTGPSQYQQQNDQDQKQNFFNSD